MNKWVAIALQVLQNIPQVVLDTREFVVTPEKPYVKKQFYMTTAGDFEVTLSAKNKTVADKKYKVIVFITDL